VESSLPLPLPFEAATAAAAVVGVAGEVPSLVMRRFFGSVIISSVIATLRTLCDAVHTTHRYDYGTVG
jgi:hypothetical protein